MSVTVGDAELTPSGEAAPDDRTPVEAAAILDICPYLTAGDGRWREVVPTRDQRCGALEPPAALTIDKQRTLCLARAHTKCATFVTAQELAVHGRRDGTTARTSLWAMTRTAPVVLERDRRRWFLPSGVTAARTSSQAGLAALMVLAFGVVVVARLGPGSAAIATSAPAVVLVSPAATPASTPEPTPAVTVTPAASPSPDASSSASAVPLQSYKVKPGDTLNIIAGKFRTTPQAIAKANGIKLTTNLRIGQTLVIPPAG